MFSKFFSLQKAFAAARRRLLILILVLGMAGYAWGPALAARQIPPVALSPTESITFTEAQLARGKQLFNRPVPSVMWVDRPIPIRMLP
jgi:hypothetical protein